MKWSEAAAVGTVAVSLLGLLLEHRSHAAEEADHIETARVLSRIIVENEKRYPCPDNR